MFAQQSEALFGQQPCLSGNIIGNGLQFAWVERLLRSMQRIAQAEPDRLADLRATGDAGQALQLLQRVNGVLPDIAGVQRLGGDRAADGSQQLFYFAIQQQHVTAVAKVAKNHLIAHRFGQQLADIQRIFMRAGGNTDYFTAGRRAA